MDQRQLACHIARVNGLPWPVGGLCALAGIGLGLTVRVESLALELRACAVGVGLVLVGLWLSDYSRRRPRAMDIASDGAMAALVGSMTSRVLIAYSNEGRVEIMGVPWFEVAQHGLGVATLVIIAAMVEDTLRNLARALAPFVVCLIGRR